MTSRNDWRVVATLLALAYLAAGLDDHKWFHVVCGGLILLLAAVDVLLDKRQAKRAER